MLKDGSIRLSRESQPPEGPTLNLSAAGSCAGSSAGSQEPKTLVKAHASHAEGPLALLPVQARCARVDGPDGPVEGEHYGVRQQPRNAELAELCHQTRTFAFNIRHWDKTW